MKNIRLAVQLASVAFATPLAFGQTPTTPDPLCDGIRTVVKAADEARPFLSLVPAGQSLGTLPKLNRNPDGFAGFSTCLLYRAGNAKDGVIGGGPFNYVRCSAHMEMTSGDQQAAAAAAQAKAKDIYDTLAARVGVCLVPDGWSASGGQRTQKYQDHETIMTFAKEGSANQVAVEFIEDAPSPGSRSKSTTRSVYLYVRNPNPLHPKQD